MILDLYFARRYVQSFALITGIFLALMMLIDLLDQLRKFEKVDASFGQVFQLMLLNVPGAISQILPLIMILSSIVLFVGLARSSELVVTRSSGRSGLRVLVGPVLVTGCIGVLAVTSLNPIVAASAQRYEWLAETYRTGQPSTLSISDEGFWLRQGGAEGQSVIHAQIYDAQAAKMSEVTILNFAPGGGPVSRVAADSAQLVTGAWQLENAKIWQLEPGVSPESKSETFDTISVETSLTQDRIQNTLGHPSAISIYDMPDTIRQLTAAGFATRQYQVWYMSELARPLFLIAMVLIGASFTMRHVRFGGTGVAVLTAVLVGFAMYFIRNFARVLGENGQLPVELAAWAPPVAAVLLATGLLLHAEDG